MNHQQQEEYLSEIATEIINLILDEAEVPCFWKDDRFDYCFDAIKAYLVNHRKAIIGTLKEWQE